MPVRSADLGSGRRADAPAETDPAVAEVHLLVLPVSEMEGVVTRSEIFTDDNRVLIHHLGQDVAHFVRMHGMLTEIPVGVLRDLRALGSW